MVVYRMPPDVARELSFVLGTKRDYGWQQDSRELFSMADLALPAHQEEGDG
jgi:hypothetical protein